MRIQSHFLISRKMVCEHLVENCKDYIIPLPYDYYNVIEYFSAMIGTHVHEIIFSSPCDKEIPKIYYERQILDRR